MNRVLTGEELLLIYGVSTAFVMFLLWCLMRVQKQIDAETEPQQPQPKPSPRPQPIQVREPQRLPTNLKPADNIKVSPPTPRENITQPDLPPPARESRIANFDVVADRLNKALHVMLVGQSGSGKSTAASWLLKQRSATDEIVILDPHATPDDWGGAEVIGKGCNYDGILEVMERITTEMNNRYKIRATTKGAQFKPMSIFVDEWPAISMAAKEKGLQGHKSFMARIAQEGRKVGMRLIILAQSDLVESLGINGMSDLREGFVTLLLGEPALKRCEDAKLVNWPAALKINGEYTAADVSGFVSYSTITEDE